MYIYDQPKNASQFTGACIVFFLGMYIKTRVLSLSKYLCSKKNYSMKTAIGLKEFSLSGHTSMFFSTISSIFESLEPLTNRS